MTNVSESKALNEAFEAWRMRNKGRAFYSVPGKFLEVFQAGWEAYRKMCWEASDEYLDLQEDLRRKIQAVEDTQRARGRVSECPLCNCCPCVCEARKRAHSMKSIFPWCDTLMRIYGPTKHAREMDEAGEE
jgi:hypothetical protein